MSAINLLLKDLIHRDKLRLGCALLGITAAAALLTWTIGLAVTTWHQGRPLCEEMGRPFDCWVATARASAVAKKGSGFQALTQGSPFKLIPQGVRELIETAPEVADARYTTVFRTSLEWRPEGRPVNGPGFGGGLAPARDFPEGCPYPGGVIEGRWPEVEGEIPEFAISARAFGDGPRPAIGTVLPVITPNGRMEARLCGYLAETIRPVGGFPTLFANNLLADATLPPEAQNACNLILIKLHPGADEKALQARVRTVVPDDDSATLVTRDELLTQLRTDAISALSRQVPLLVILAFVATICLIVNTLCIGIEQHRLRYARLRAMGMTQAQLARLVASEGGLLVGYGGVLGLAIGAGLLASYVYTQPALFPDGLSLGWLTPGGVGCAFLVALGLGLLLPLRHLHQLDPALMRSSTLDPLPKHPWLQMLIGVLLLVPILLTPFQLIREPMTISMLFVLVALPCAIIGLLRLTPLILILCEKGLTRPLAWLLGLHKTLLQGLLTRAIRRHSRMALTLTAGLGAFFAIHIWGSSLTDPFLPSRELPPAIVSILPNGTSPECVRPWIENGTCRPLSANQYRLHDDDFEAIIARTGLTPAQNNILLLATPGEEGVTVTEMFARQCGLREGATFRIQRKEADGAIYTLPLTITHVRKINWHLFTARAGLRARNGAPFGTLGPVFVNDALAKQWDPQRNATITFLWGDKLTATTDEALYTEAQALEDAIQSVVKQTPLEGKGKRRLAAQVSVRLRDEIHAGTLSHSNDLVGALARLPLWSLLILCIGFIPLLTANVRTMEGELRTLHAIGMTQSQMMRYLLAQALLLTLSTIALSLILGIVIGWSFTGWTLAWMPFGGLPTVFILPWAQLLKGTLLLCTITLLIAYPLLVCLLRQRQ